jgi:hypothetical protein
MKYDKQDQQGKAAFNERLHITDKTSKSRQHILRVIQQYSSRNIGTTQLENAEKLKLKIPQAERSLRIDHAIDF